MAGKPFDATTKQLIQAHPEDWLQLLGLPARKITVVDADVATVSANADKVLMVDANPPYIAHLELQSGYKDDDAERFMVYNVLLSRQYGIRVRTVIFLLRPSADGPAMHTPLQRQFAGEPPYLTFDFRVVRLWQEPVSVFLEGGVGTLPLAPLCSVTRKALPGVIHEMKQRIDAEAPDEAGMLWTSTYILMGLRYPPQFTEQLLKGARNMKESVTYQAILQEGEAIGEARGEAIGERKALMRLGAKRFGPANAETVTTIESITAVEQIEQLLEKLLEAESWDELLAGINTV